MHKIIYKIKNFFRRITYPFRKRVYAKRSKQWGPVFRKATEIYFKDLKKDFKEWGEKEITITDVEYMDSYFLFTSGDNSIVHFHIKEAPGWKFGIWWGTSIHKPTEHYLITHPTAGKIFAQYEEILDKFKPTASEICKNIKIWKNENHDPSSYRMINFIITEPALAFCRDYMYRDYNEEYLSREDALKIFEEYKVKRDLTAKWQKEYSDAMIKFAKEVIFPSLKIKNGELRDLGEGWYPRYDLCAPLKDNPELFAEPGFYNIEDLEVQESECYKKFLELTHFYEEKAEEEDISLDTPYDFYIWAK